MSSPADERFEERVRPVATAGTRRILPRSWVGTALTAALVVTLVVAALLARRSGAGPVPGRRTVLGLEAESALWAIDLSTLEVSVRDAPAPAVPWHATLDDRRVADVFYVGPRGGVDLAELPGEVFAVLVTGLDVVGSTPLPAALVPIWPGSRPEGVDLVIVRRGSRDDSWTDILPLPGCGLPLPIAAPDATDVLSVWCTDIEDVRLLVEFPAPGAITPPNGGGEALIVTADGSLWNAVLDEDGAASRAIRLGLRPGEWLPGVTALSPDGTLLLVGVTAAADPGALSAERIIAYDRENDRAVWEATTPVPFESLTFATNDEAYAYYSAGGDAVAEPALMSVDTGTGAAGILISPLDLGKGRLRVLAP